MFRISSSLQRLLMFMKKAANLKLPRAFLMFYNPLEEYLCYLPNDRNKFTTKNPLFNKHYAEICLPSKVAALLPELLP